MSEWEDIKARLSVGFMGHVSDGSCKAEKPCMGCDIRAALEEIERRGLQYPDDLGISRDAAGLSARCAELRDRLVAQGKRAEAAEAKLAEAEHHHADYHAICSARNDTCPQEAEVERLEGLIVALSEDERGLVTGEVHAEADRIRAALRGGGERCLCDDDSPNHCAKCTRELLCIGALDLAHWLVTARRKKA